MKKHKQDTLWATRPCKDEVRKLTMSNDFGRPSKSMLLMPGAQLCDIREGLNTGLISPSDTRLVLIERNRGVQESIRYQLANDKAFIGLRHVHLWPNALDALDTLPDGYPPFDHVYMDFNGSVTARDALWIHQFLSKHLSANSSIAFTCLEGSRGNKFLRDIYHLFDSPEVKAHGQELSRMFSIYKQDRLAILFSTITILLTPFEFRLRDIGTYFDTSSMFFFRLTHLKKPKGKRKHKILDHLLPVVEKHQGSVASNRRRGERLASSPRKESVMRSSSSNGTSRSNAAHKAWATRRKQAKKRSDAAKKAWATRRRQNA